MTQNRTPKIGMRLADPGIASDNYGITCCGSSGCGGDEPMRRASAGALVCPHCDCVVAYDNLTITGISRCKHCR
jgi:hypothetical protein